MKHVKVLDVSQRVHGKVGRPKAVTKEELLHAIEMYATDSVTILAKKLQVSRKTIYARLEEIPRKKINGILMTLADSTLIPAKMDYTVFEQIPAVQRYRDMLAYNRKVSHGYLKQRIRSLHKLCCILRLHPMHLNQEHIEECAILVAKVERGEITTQTRYGIQRMGVDSTKKTLRSWFENRGVSGQLLTAEGIDGSASEGMGKRSRLE